MGERSDADTRYFPDVVDRVVNAWRDLGPDGARGRVVVVSGTPQSGRSTVLAQVAEDLRRGKIRVVRRAVRDGVLQAVDESGSGEHAVQAVTVLAAALQVAGAGLVGGLVALGAEIAATRRMIDAEPTRVPSDPYVHVHRVAEAVRERAAQEPLALLIDDADRLDHPDVWWDALFGTTLPRLAARLPVLVVLGVERTSTARSAALEVVDTKLLPAGLAEEVRLPPLDPSRIAAALGPVDDAVADQLRSLVYGRPAWLDEVWREWREQGVVVHRDGRWALGAAARDRGGVSLHGWIDAALRAEAPDGDAFWRAKEIVRTAALEGPRFTAEALAIVLNEDVEDLIDWIDDHLTDPDGPSLLIDDGFVERAEGVEPSVLRCYRFRSAMVAGVLRKEVLDGADGKVLAGRYARALAQVYQYSSVSGIAWTMSRLATTAGDKELAETIWRRANRLEGLEAAARLARFLVEHLDVETAPPEELAAAVERLNDLTGQLTGEWNTEETLDFCRCAERAAHVLSKRAGDHLDPERVLALRISTSKDSGFAALKANQAELAVVKLTEAADLSAGTSNDVRTANLYRLLAVSEIGGFFVVADSIQRSQLHASLALKHAARDTSLVGRVTLADCLLAAAQISIPFAGRSAVAEMIRDAAGTLLELSGKFDGPHLIQMCLVNAAQLSMFEGRRAVEERFSIAALRCGGDVDSLSVILMNLSESRQALGDLTGAARAACQAQRLAQGYDDTEDGLALLHLAKCARGIGAPLARAFAVLAEERIRRSASYSVITERALTDFGDVLAQLDDTTRQQIEHDYRSDRGASLIREAFGIDVDEIDALNERLGDATEEELRGFLRDVQEYCTRATDDPTSGTVVG